MYLQLLLDHQDAIAPEHNDPIHELLEDLGEVPTVESLIGEWTTYSVLYTTILGSNSLSICRSSSRDIL